MALSGVQIYKFLPKTNCKECGFPTCLSFAMKLAKDFNAAGVIWYQIQYCESYDMEGYYFSEKMKEAGMPMIILESDYGILDRGQLKTRVETFIEIAKTKKEVQA